MAQITAADLLVGSDEDFAINLYLAVLGRWPDPVGFGRMVQGVAGSQAARTQAIIDLSASEEAATRGRAIEVPDPLLPSEPMEAMQRQLALRTDFLHQALQQRPAALDDTRVDVEPLLRELRTEMAALRREMRERLAALREETAVPLRDVPAPDIADYLNDLLALAEARMEIRLRALEKRLP